MIVEDDAQAQARMRELDERIEAQGGVGTEDDFGTRGGFGSATTMIDKARAELGYRETGENDTKYNRWLGAIAGLPRRRVRVPVVPRLPVLVPRATPTTRTPGRGRPAAPRA